MSKIILSGCLILKEGSILLVKKKTRNIWELPGGAGGANLEENAISNTKNQIGVAPLIIQQFDVLEFQKNSRNVEATIFECNIEPQAEFKPGEEIEDVKWFKLEDLKNNEVKNLGEDVLSVLDGLQI